MPPRPAGAARPTAAARPVASPGTAPRVGTAGRPVGPLVADPDVDRYRRRPPQQPAGRVRRFVRRYGWRAYAIPLLAVATVGTLADLALKAPSASSTSAAVVDTAAPSPEVLPPVEESPPSAEADAGPTDVPAADTAESYVERGAGSVTVVDGTSPVYGTGPLRRFVVETEDGTEVDGAAFAQAVEATLGDPRSWGAGGRMSFQRVGAAEAAAGEYEFKVSLISPGSMETYCPGVGTGGYTSCRYGERAVINLARWATAVPHYGGDIATYRQYVVNHEVGHALGNGHEPCPGPGQPAPVMQQQTLDLESCTPNAWPHP